MSNKLITQTDRNLMLYPPGSGIKIKKSACWRIDPRRRRGDTTAAKKLLFDEGINFKFFRVLSITEENNGGTIFQNYLFEYWD